MKSRAMTRAFYLWGLMLALWPHAAAGQTPTPSKAAKALPRLSQSVRLDARHDNTTPDAFHDEAAKARWSFFYRQDMEVRFLRLRVMLRHPATNGAAWYLLVRDAAKKEVERLTPDSFHGKPPDAQAWTDTTDGREVTVELWSDLNPVNLKIEIERVNYEFQTPGPRAVTGGVDSSKPLLEYTPDRGHSYYQFSLPVAIIRFVAASNGMDSNCTGFLLTPELLITNQHCISEDWQLSSARVEFNFEPSPPRKETFKISKIEMQDVPLDFTLLRLKRPAAGWPTVKLDGNPQNTKQPLVLIGHPSGAYKTISVVDCEVEHLRPPDRPDRPDDFYHLCDTEIGESGSPVFDAATGRVVGLHYHGITGLHNDGRNLAVNINAVLEKIRTTKGKDEIYKHIIQHTQ